MANLVQMVLVCLALVACAGSWAQEPIWPPGIDPLRVATEREMGLNTIEVRGYYAGFGAGAEYRFRFRHRAPDQYEFLVAHNAGKATVLAISGNRAMFYDADDGTLLLVNHILPQLTIGVARDGSLTATWGLSTRWAKTANYLQVDLTAIFQHPGIRKHLRKEEGDRKYRLHLWFEDGTAALAMIDGQALFGVTEFYLIDTNIDANGGVKLYWKMQVNHDMPPLVPFLSAGSLRKQFTVHEMDMPKEVPVFMRLLRMPLMPLAATSENGRKIVENSFEEKPDWDAMKARVERDLPKLRQLIPLP